MKGFASERSGNREAAAINLRAGGSRDHASHMAYVAPEFIKQIGSPLCHGGVHEFLIPSGRLGCPQEAREVVHIGKTVRSGLSLGSDTVLQSLVISSGNNCVVTPISFR
jgi:hypothetical protein